MYFVFNQEIDNDIANNIGNIIDEVGFVILKNKDKDIELNNIIKYFGKPINLNSFKINDNIKKNNLILSITPYISSQPKLSGFCFSNISPHTDTGFLKKPAEYVFIKMNKEDVINNNYGKNGIVDVFEIVKRLKGSKIIKQLSVTKFPVLVNKKNKVKFKTILKLNRNGTLKLVRFNIDRILSAYNYLNINPTYLESRLLNKFLKICNKNINYFSLTKGDILIIDNHLMLHSRTSCNVSYLNKNIESREVEVAFVRKIK